MTLTVHVDHDFCMSSGRCVAEEPAVFRFDDDEVAEPTGSTEGVDRERLLDAARGCPGAAITILDETGTMIS